MCKELKGDWRAWGRAKRGERGVGKATTHGNWRPCLEFGFYYKNNRKPLAGFKQRSDVTGFSFFKNLDGWVERIAGRQGGNKDTSLEMTAAIQERAGGSLDQGEASGGGRSAWILILF